MSMNAKINSKIQKLIQAEVQKEIYKYQQQLNENLAEVIAETVTAVFLATKNGNTNYKPPVKAVEAKPVTSGNPISEILSTVKPFDNKNILEYLGSDVETPVDQVYIGTDNRPINVDNVAVKSVLNVIENMNFSDTLKKMDRDVKKFRG